MAETDGVQDHFWGEYHAFGVDRLLAADTLPPLRIRTRDGDRYAYVRCQAATSDLGRVWWTVDIVVDDGHPEAMVIRRVEAHRWRDREEAELAAIRLARALGIPCMIATLSAGWRTVPIGLQPV